MKHFILSLNIHKMILCQFPKFSEKFLDNIIIIFLLRLQVEV